MSGQRAAVGLLRALAESGSAKHRFLNLWPVIHSEPAGGTLCMKLLRQVGKLHRPCSTHSPVPRPTDTHTALYTVSNPRKKTLSDLPELRNQQEQEQEQQEHTLRKATRNQTKRYRMLTAGRSRMKAASHKTTKTQRTELLPMDLRRSRKGWTNQLPMDLRRSRKGWTNQLVGCCSSKQNLDLPIGCHHHPGLLQSCA